MQGQWGTERPGWSEPDTLHCCAPNAACSWQLGKLRCSVRDGTLLAAPVQNGYSKSQSSQVVWLSLTLVLCLSSHRCRVGKRLINRAHLPEEAIRDPLSVPLYVVEDIVRLRLQQVGGGSNQGLLKRGELCRD